MGYGLWAKSSLGQDSWMQFSAVGEELRLLISVANSP
jgi:hypothetical protein